MKNGRPWLSGAVNVGILWLGLQAGAVAATPINLRADTWYPFNGDPQDANPGYIIEVAKKAWALVGHTVNYETQPWQRAIDETRKGNSDCVIGAYKEDVPDFIFPDEPVGKVGQTFYIKKGTDWRYSGDIQKLNHITLGIIGGYVYSDGLTQYLASNKNHNVEEIKADNALEQNLKKVAAGRIQATIETQYVAEAKIRQMGLSGQIESAGDLSPPAPIYIACSPAKATSAGYAKSLSEGIKQLRASGELQRILDKYQVKDWQ